MASVEWNILSNRHLQFPLRQNGMGCEGRRLWGWCLHSHRNDGKDFYVAQHKDFPHSPHTRSLFTIFGCWLFYLNEIPFCYMESRDGMSQPTIAALWILKPIGKIDFQAIYKWTLTHTHRRPTERTCNQMAIALNLMKISIPRFSRTPI